MAKTQLAKQHENITSEKLLEVHINHNLSWENPSMSTFLQYTYSTYCSIMSCFVPQLKTQKRAARVILDYEYPSEDFLGHQSGFPFMTE